MCVSSQYYYSHEFGRERRKKDRANDQKRASGRPAPGDTLLTRAAIAAASS